MTHGAYGFALHAEAGGRITAQGLTVETTADDADAVNADGAGSSITLNRVSITTSAIGQRV